MREILYKIPKNRQKNKEIMAAGDRAFERLLIDEAARADVGSCEAGGSARCSLVTVLSGVPGGCSVKHFRQKRI